MEYLKIDDIAKDIRYGFNGKSHQENTGFKILRITDIQKGRVDWNDVPNCEISDSELDKYFLQEGDIVFSRSGNTVGKTYLLEKDFPKAIYASYLIRIRIKEVTTAKFLYYYFHTDEYWKKIREGISGIGQPNFNGKKLSNLEVPYPPLPEQHRIVAKIEELFSELDNGVANLERTKDQLQTYRQSVLKHAFEGRLTENWRAHNPAQSRHAFTAETGSKAAEPQAVYQQTAQATASNDISQETLENLPGPELLEYIKAERQRQYEHELKKWEQKAKAAKAKGQKKPARPKKPKEMDPLTEEELQQLPELPEGWYWVQVGDLGNIETGSTPNKKEPDNFGGDFLFFKPTDLNAGINVQKSHEKLTKKGFEQSRKIPENSVLVTCIGATIGKTGIVRSEGGFNQQINAIIPSSFVIPEFVYYQVISKFFQENMFDRASSTTLPILNKNRFKELPFILTPIQEQKQIVREIESRLSVADNLSESIDQSLQQAQSMRQSILKKAFEGALVENEEEVEAETS